MKKLFRFLATFFAVLLAQSQVHSQTLGGYTIYDHLASSVHPHGCDDAYVSNIPDDSIWVNFDPNEFITGLFSMPSTDKPGVDLLLETGFNTSNYIVSLLLANGTYTDTHYVSTSSWIGLSGSTPWIFLFNSCGIGFQVDSQYISVLDYNTHFNLTASDTVTGIKIIFLTSMGAPDLAGVYIVSPQTSGIGDPAYSAAISLSPNPFTETIHLTGPANELTEFSLYDLTAREVLTFNFSSGAALNVSHLNKGIYLYRFRIDDQVIKQGKILKE